MGGILQKDITLLWRKLRWLWLLFALFPLCLHGIWPALGLVFLVPFWISLFWNTQSEKTWRWYQMVLTRIFWLIITLIPVPLGGVYWSHCWNEPYRLRDAWMLTAFLFGIGCVVLLLCVPRIFWNAKHGTAKRVPRLTGLLIKILVLVIYAVVAVHYGIWLVIGVLLGYGGNLSVEAAAPYWVDIQTTPKIEFGDYVVFYETKNTIDDYSDKWISEIAPISGNILYTHHITDGRQGEIIWNAETGEQVGHFYTYEADGQYHNFFMPKVNLSDWTQIPEFVRAGYDKVTANGQEIDIFKHSYFITDAQIENFVISGVPLTIHKPEIEPPVEESYTIAVYTGHLGRSFHFASSGTFEYRGDGPTKEGVYEKTEVGIFLYFRERGKIVETADLPFTDRGTFLYNATEFKCTNKEAAWDTYPLYEKPLC